MSLDRIRRAGRKKHSPLFVERLEDRAVPDANLVSIAVDARGAPTLTGVNEDVVILGRSDNGQTLLVQTSSTNLIAGQDSPPLQTNLFLLDVSGTPTFTLITGKASIVGNTQGARRTAGLGAVASTPGVELNAVLSGDGNKVAFLSSAPAELFGIDPAVVIDAGGTDLFVWQRFGEGGTIEIASKTPTGQSIGGIGSVTNPSISFTGDVVAFVSTANARTIMGGDKTYYDRAYDVIGGKGTSTGLSPDATEFFIQTVFDPITGLPIGTINVDVLGKRFIETNLTPDLFRVEVGGFPRPVSYSLYTDTLDDENGFYTNGRFGQNPPDAVDGNTGATILMNGDVDVDPLGRYMNSTGTGFVFSRRSRVNSSLLPGRVIHSFDEGLWRFSFNRNQGDADDVPASIGTQLFSPITTNPAAGELAQIVAGGVLFPPAISTRSSDIVVPYLSYDINRPTTNIIPLASQPASPQLYRVPASSSKDGFRVIGAELVTSQYAPTGPYVQSKDIPSTGQLFPLSREKGAFQLPTSVSVSGALTPAGKTTVTTPTPSPSSYQFTPDATRVLFVTDGKDIGGQIDPTDVTARNWVRVDYTNSKIATEGDRSAFQVHQRFIDEGKNLVVSIRDRQTALLPFDSTNPVMTDDGLSVAFLSTAKLQNQSGAEPFAFPQVFLWERVEGKPASLGARPRTTLATTGPEDAVPVAGANGDIKGLVITGGYNRGRSQSRLFYSSTATNLDPNATQLNGITFQLYQSTLPVFITDALRTTVVSADRGVITLGAFDAQGNLTVSQRLQPFGSRFTGELRVALADVDGDGAPDVIVGAGFGAGPRVAVLASSVNFRAIRDFFAYESSFRGGVYVAGADINGDGRAEVIVGAGEGGGPRIQVFDGASDALIFDQFAYESTARTGVRVAAADVTGDSIPEIVAAAGIGGGPRVRIYDGAAARAGQTFIYADFFAYEQTQRGGVFIAAGDYDGDGYADILTGGGPDGGPRVTVFNGFNVRDKNPSIPEKFQDFFAFNPDSRDGARPVFKNVIGQKNADIVVGTGNGPPVLAVFNGTSPQSAAGPVRIREQLASTDPLALFGAWVG